MPIPPFNKDGLLPPGIHSAAMLEVERRLGFSPKRRTMIENGLKPVVQELRGLGFSEVYLDGTFVSAKPSPDDIDGYLHTRLDSKTLDAIVQRQETWRTRYQLDFYPAYEDLKGESSVEYWQSWFGHTDDEPPKEKGIIKLTLGR
jgi:hypothetical protein